MERSDKREMRQIESTKKPYTRPRLEVYGNLREITLSGNPNGSVDGNAMHAKTHV